jgi:H+/Cl- antiporter ClcA
VSGSAVDQQTMTVVTGIVVFFGVLIGLVFADAFFGLLWIIFFHSGEYATWEPLKIWFFLLIAFICGCIATIIPGIFGG